LGALDALSGGSLENGGGDDGSGRGDEEGVRDRTPPLPALKNSGGGIDAEDDGDGAALTGTTARSAADAVSVRPRAALPRA